MKKITNYFKMLIVLCAFASAKTSLAQSPCQVSFTYSIGLNGSVTFFGTAVGSSSTAPGVYYWGFGNTTSANGVGLNQPSCTYTANGSYVVFVVYSNSAFTCSSSAVQTVVITNVTAPSNTCNLNANCNYSQGANGLVNFNNTSTGTAGGTTYNWAFGDASPNSTSTSPGHIYASNGTYVVTLTANNNFSYTCSSVKTLTITVNSYCNLNANFTYSQNNGIVSFVNTSTGMVAPTLYSWNFGDNTAASSMSPNHGYSANGSYNVMLTVTNFSSSPTCMDTVMKTIVVNTVPTNTCVANSNFSVVPTATAQYWVATPASPGNIVNAVWYWGDNSSTNQLYTSHTYSAAGSYDICLSVTVTCGGTSTSCFSYAIFKPSGNSDQGMLTVNVLDPSTVDGIKNSTAENASYILSPNPNNGSFNLNIRGLAPGKANISIYDVVGSMVYQSDAETNAGGIAKDIQLERVPNGVYFIKVKSENKEFTKKLVISNK